MKVVEKIMLTGFFPVPISGTAVAERSNQIHSGQGFAFIETDRGVEVVRTGKRPVYAFYPWNAIACVSYAYTEEKKKVG